MKKTATAIGAIIFLGTLMVQANEAVLINAYLSNQKRHCTQEFRAQQGAIPVGEIKSKARDLREYGSLDQDQDITKLEKRYLKMFSEKSELNGVQGTYSFANVQQINLDRKTGDLERSADYIGGKLIKHATVWGGFIGETSVDSTVPQAQLSMKVVFHPNKTKAQLAEEMCQDLAACLIENETATEKPDHMKAAAIESIKNTKSQLGCKN